jgi:hypothetical protein
MFVVRVVIVRCRLASDVQDAWQAHGAAGSCDRQRKGINR